MAEPVQYSSDMGALYIRFVEERAALAAQLEGERVKYAWLNTAGSQDAKRSFDISGSSEDELKKLNDDAAAWLQDKCGAAKAKLEELQGLSQELAGLGFGAADVSVDECSSLASTVEESVTQWTRRCQDETKRRKDKVVAVDRFMQDDAKLLQWCRQERSNLEALTEVTHRQEFCYSLLPSFATMHEYFQRLAAATKPLLPDREVEKALVEVNEVWLYLQILALETMQMLMFEIHPTARLEDEVRAFANFTVSLNEHLSGTPTSARELLELPADEHSRQMLKEPLKLCKALKEDLVEFRKLPDELRDFAARMELMRANYKSFRQHVLGKLTFLGDPSSRPEDRAAARMQEYSDRTSEIRSWSKDVEDAETWKGLHEKVVSLKELIQSQLAACRKTAAAERPAADEEDEQF